MTNSKDGLINPNQPKKGDGLINPNKPKKDGDIISPDKKRKMINQFNLKRNNELYNFNLC